MMSDLPVKTLTADQAELEQRYHKQIEEAKMAAAMGDDKKKRKKGSKKGKEKKEKDKKSKKNKKTNKSPEDPSLIDMTGNGIKGKKGENGDMESPKVAKKVRVAKSGPLPPSTIQAAAAVLSNNGHSLSGHLSQVTNGNGYNANQNHNLASSPFSSAAYYGNAPFNPSDFNQFMTPATPSSSNSLYFPNGSSPSGNNMIDLNSTYLNNIFKYQNQQQSQPSQQLFGLPHQEIHGNFYKSPSPTNTMGAPTFSNSQHFGRGPANPMMEMETAGIHFPLSQQSPRISSMRNFPGTPPPPTISTPLSPPPTTTSRTENIFRIFQQPFDKQRKSYKNENRYLLPNPMVVCPVQTVGIPAVTGTVSVRLVFENGQELGPDRQGILHGTLIKELDAEKRASFVLKCLDTSDGYKFKLVFTVKYSRENDPRLFEESIHSHPFIVTSNKKKQLVDRPVIIDLKPSSGPSHLENEVWIKGCQFTDRAGMIVKFDGKEAKVIETEDNLITCLAPARPDILQNTKVSVEVCNFHPAEGALSGDRTLEYTYEIER